MIECYIFHPYVQRNFNFKSSSILKVDFEQNNRLQIYY